MFSQEQLQELLALDVQDQRILSIYLDADSGAEPIETIKLRVRGMIKEAKLGQDKGVAAVEQYLDHSYDWSKPGLALFSSTGGDFFRAYPTAVSFRNRFRVGVKPYVKPLAHLLDHYAHYGVILVDRVGARFFEYHLGELQLQDGYLGEDVRKLKKGGGSSAVGMRGGLGGARREEEVVHRNLREAADAAKQFFSRRAIRRLFLGGTSETVAQFRELLPKMLQSSVAGIFALDMNASEHEVGVKTLALLREANLARESELVETLFSTHAQGGNAVIDIDETLQAVSDKRVQTLVISDGFRQPGYMHEESGLVVSNVIRSPMGESELTAVDDVIDVAVSLTIGQGGQVEIVAENPTLKRIGHVGAILRY